MKISSIKRIGTHFKKENVFLATIVYSDEYKRTLLRQSMGEEIYRSETFEELVRVVNNEQHDLFYKDENGYTRFTEEGTDTFAGDNSDGKGIIKNIVSAWDYYPEQEVKEAVINGEHLAIMVHDPIPLFWYSQKYSKNIS